MKQKKNKIIKFLFILIFIVNISVFAQEGWQIQQSSRSLNSVVYSDANTAWAVGLSGLFRKSTDGGATWQYIQDFPSSSSYNKIFFVSPETGWILTSSGKNLKTTDGGDSWFEHYAYIQGTNDRVLNGTDMYFISESTGWICTTEGQIYKTTNGGTSWFEQQSNITSRLRSIYFAKEKIGWTAGAFGGVWHTDDGGENWELQSSGVAEELNSIYFITPEKGFAAGDKGSLIITSNGGKNWFNLTTITNISFEDIYFVSPSIGFLVGRKASVFQSFIYKTIDGGQTWKVKLENEDIYQFSSVHFSSAENGLVVGFNNTIKRTTNGGETWTTMSKWKYSGFNSLHFISSQFGWVVGNGGTILRTSNGGESFTELTSETTAKLNSVHFTSGTTGYVVGNENTLLKTTDGGDNWTSLASSLPSTGNNLNSISFAVGTSQRAVVVGSNGQIFATSNSGSNWTERTSGTSSNLNAVKGISFNSFCAVGDSGVILKSTDSGATWEILDSRTDKDLYSIGMINSSKIFVGGDGVMRKTTNAGANWSNQITMTFIPNIFSIDFSTSTNGWAAVNYYGLFYTTDGGLHWDSQQLPIPSFSNQSVDVDFVSPNIGWVITANGDILKTIDGGIEPIIPEEYTIYEIQKTPNGGDGSSIYNGRYVKTSGVVTAVYDDGNPSGYFIQDGRDEWNGIFIDNSNSSIIAGMDITIIGDVDELSDYTRIRSVDSIFINSPNAVIPEPIIISTDDCNKESYEGVLVSTMGVCDNDSLNLSREWSINDGSGSIRISRQAVDFKPFVGNQYKVTGAVYQGYDFMTKALLPTDSSAIIDLTVGINNPPVISSLPDTLHIAGNSSLTINLWGYVEDFETPDSLLAYEFSISTDSLLAVFDSTKGELLISAINNFAGNANLVITVTDDSNAVAQDSTLLIVDQITGLNDLVNVIPDEYELYQNYPNPFNPATKIRYGLPFQSEVNIRVYNLLGQVVKLLTNNIQNAGFHEINFNAGSLASGVYIYRISANSLTGSDKFQTVKKMLLLK